MWVVVVIHDDKSMESHGPYSDRERARDKRRELERANILDTVRLAPLFLDRDGMR